MDILTSEIHLHTKGKTHIIDITAQVGEIIGNNSFKEGQVTVFAIGSTTGISTVEFEPGLVDHDIRGMFDKIAPYTIDYRHNDTWNDDNGAAHLRSTLLKTSMVFPFKDGHLLLGTWQQIIFIDFDTRSRNRTIIVQVIGNR